MLSDSNDPPQESASAASIEEESNVSTALQNYIALHMPYEDSSIDGSRAPQKFPMVQEQWQPQQHQQSQQSQQSEQDNDEYTSQQQYSYSDVNMPNWLGMNVPPTGEQWNENAMTHMMHNGNMQQMNHLHMNEYSHIARQQVQVNPLSLWNAFPQFATDNVGNQSLNDPTMNCQAQRYMHQLMHQLSSFLIVVNTMGEMSAPEQNRYQQTSVPSPAGVSYAPQVPTTSPSLPPQLTSGTVPQSPSPTESNQNRNSSNMLSMLGGCVVPGTINSCQERQGKVKKSQRTTDSKVLAALSCENCRRKHKRCDKRLPRCSKCERKGTECVYRKRKKRVSQPKKIAQGSTNSDRNSDEIFREMAER